MSSSASGNTEETIASQPTGREPPLLGNKFRLLRCLSVQADELVFDGVHTGTERRVRVHMLRDTLEDEPLAIERMKRAARAAGRVPHSHVLSVVDSGLDQQGRPFAVYEHFGELTLRDWMEQVGPVPTDVAARIVCQLLEALSALHQRGVIHRNVRPENVLVEQSSEVRVKLMGFGFAVVQGKLDNAPALPRGYSRYAAPELRRNAEASSSAIDIYAVGVLMRHLLTGDPASFEGIDARAERAVRRAGAEDPDERFTAAEHFLASVSMLLPDSGASLSVLPEDRLVADLRYMQQRRERESGVTLSATGASRMELYPVLLMLEAIYARLGAAGWKQLCDELPAVEALLPGAGHGSRLQAEGVPSELVIQLLRRADALAGRGDLAWLTEVGEALVKRGLERFCPRLPAQLTPAGLVDCVSELWASIARHGEVVVLERREGCARVAIRAQAAPSLEVCAVMAGLLRAELRMLSSISEVSTVASQALGDAADIFVITWLPLLDR